MEAAYNRLLEVYGGINTGRPRPSLLDGVKVDYHGSSTPIKHLALISKVDNALTVQPFDPNSLGDIERAIRNSGLGLSTVPAKTSILVPIPPLSGDRMAELAKFAAKVAEEQRVAIRNVRRDALKSAEKLELTEDELRGIRDRIDELAQSYTSRVDSELNSKATELTVADPRWNQPKGRKR